MPFFDQIKSLLEAYADVGPQIVQVFHEIFQALFYLDLSFLTIVSAISLLGMIYVLVKKKQPYKERPIENFPFVTVQIPTMNELCALTCAQKCLDFDYPKDKYEILIGDDSNRPEVSRKIAEFSKTDQRLKVFKREKNEGFKAGNLNNLLKHSKGEYLVIFDSDFLPKPDFLKRVIAPMVHDKSVAAVQARWGFSNPDQNMVSILSTMMVAVFHHIMLPFFNKNRGLSILCGSAEAVRKNILKQKGGWRSGSLTEDIEYSLRLFDEGYKIRYLPDLECESQLPFKLKDLCRQQKRWAYGVIESVKIHSKEIILSKKMKAVDKLFLIYLFSGYLIATGLGLLLILGVLSTITHEPAPIDFKKFFFEAARNTIITAGFLITGIYALKRAGYFNKAPQTILAAFSIGMIVVYHVNLGIIRVFLNKPLDWYALSKKNNKIENF